MWRKLADELVEERLNRLYADAWSCPEVCLPCLFDSPVDHVISAGPILADLIQNGAGASPVLLECRFEGLPVEGKAGRTRWFQWPLGRL